jgi:hypothetical protein
MDKTSVELLQEYRTIIEGSARHCNGNICSMSVPEKCQCKCDLCKPYNINESYVDGDNYPAYVPEIAIDLFVGNMDILTSDEKITNAVQKRISKNNKATPEQIQMCIKYALDRHHDNQRLFKFNGTVF